MVQVHIYISLDLVGPRDFYMCLKQTKRASRETETEAERERGRGEPTSGRESADNRGSRH